MQEKMREDKNDYTIAAVVRALKLLKLFSYDAREMSLTELSQKAQIGKSSVLRVLASLEQENFIKYDPNTKKYKLGIEIFRLSNTAFEFLGLKETARPLLKQFSNEHKLHMHLAVPEEHSVVVIDRVYPFENHEMIGMVSEIGGEVPLHCTGVGKVLLAFSAPEVQERMIASCNFERYSDRTITDPDVYRALLRQVAKEGYAVNNGEHEPFITCVTFPLYNYRGALVGAVSATGLSQIMQGEFLSDIRDQLRVTSRQISQLLGA